MNRTVLDAFLTSAEKALDELATTREKRKHEMTPDLERKLNGRWTLVGRKMRQIVSPGCCFWIML
jgi:hypothetical protein